MKLIKIILIVILLTSNRILSQIKVDLFTGWSGSSTADHILWQPPYENGKGWYAAIYSPDEMTKGGTIQGNNTLNSLRWNLQYDNQGAGSTRTFTGVNIYLYHLSISSFANTSKPNLPVGAVKVFSGTIDFKVPNTSQTVCEIHVPFSTNFVYDGTSSLVVYIEKITPDYQITNPYFALLSDPNHSAIRNVGSYKGNLVSDYDNTKKYIYPQIKFNDNNTPTCFGGIVLPIKPPIPTGSSTQNFCINNNPKISDLIVVGSNIKWYNQLIGGSVLSPTQSITNGTYYATQTVLGVESDRFSVTVTVTNPQPPTTTSVIQSFCDYGEISDLSVNSSGVVNWYSTNTSNVILPNNTPLIDGGKYYSTTSIGVPSCESINRLEVTVKLIKPTDPVINNSSQTFCLSLNAKVSDIKVNGSSINFYLDNTTTTPLTGNEILVNGKYFVSSTISGCESNRKEIDVTISDPTISSITNSTQSFCSSSSPELSDLVVYSSIGTVVKWYETISSNLELPNNLKLINGNTYYATAYNSSSLCESSNRFQIKVNIISPNIPTTTNTNQTFCITENAKVSDLSVISTYGSSINWYSTSSSNIILSNNESLINGETYYATEVTNGLPSCESVDRLEVLVKIIDLPLSPYGNSNQYFCKNGNPVVSNLTANGFSIKWYDSKDGNILCDGNMPLVDGNHYFSTQTEQGCEGIKRLEVVVHLSDIQLTLNSKKKPFCNKNDGGLDVLVNGNIGKCSYLWDEGKSTSSILENIGSGSHRITVTDSIGCVIVKDFELDCIESQIPQIVTPGGNGKNETWVLKLSPESEVKIFNRWGNLVYLASPYVDDWNGQNNQGSIFGKGFLPNGTYYYLIDKKDGGEILSGFIELLR